MSQVRQSKDWFSHCFHLLGAFADLGLEAGNKALTMNKKLTPKQLTMLKTKGYYYATTEYGRKKIIPYANKQGFKQQFIVL